MSDPECGDLLRLDETTLVLFPAQTRESGVLRESTVVQVMVHMEPHSTSPTLEEVAAFYNAQEEITITMQMILLENLINPSEKVVEIEGDGYMLIGTKKEWSYGRQLELTWGKEEVRAAEDKWVFSFSLIKGIDEEITKR
ncbi:S-adenosyl-L-methionine-dependent methyltransferase [Favolaschia claudopus]|uniref:S-adenosyl-L-methionine-dependent methyltransferase n=1 Tax=Favolaschia claudopus TaxID=2862362 RepID=A0AAW0D0A6_9AGAR